MPRHDSGTRPSETGLSVIVDQLRALVRARFGDGSLNALTARDMETAEGSLRMVLGMY